VNLLSAFGHLLGHGRAPDVNINTGGKVASHPALTPAQRQSYNALMEADGARMFNQAHPGQVYRTNQNNELKPGELPAYLPPGKLNYVGYRQPVPQTTQFAGHLLNNFAPSGVIQGQPINLQQPQNLPVIRIR